MSSEPGLAPGAAIAGLLAALETLSRSRPDRVLRLSGSLPVAALEQGWTAAAREPAGTDQVPAGWEPFELLIFRGFSSLTTHPTAFDPDRAALPEGARISSAELLAAPLDPDGGVPLAGPVPAEACLAPECWA